VARHGKAAGTYDRQSMARYFDIHPDNPQPRLIGKVVDLLRSDALIAYPTDSCYALGCRVGNTHGLERIRQIRQLDDRHHFTLVCANFTQLGSLVHLDNAVFRAIRAATPGSYTFILPAERDVPRRVLQPRKRTVGVRIPAHTVTQALLAELGEPLLSSTLLLPGEDDPLTEGWVIADRLEHVVDAVIDSGDCGAMPTTVIDFSDGYPVVVRRGAGDPARFEEE
jgi:tRNA threonylcarbamoyl adenosine modification protein (Sua5/YciO/YrdC/YwlC family)